MLRAAFTFSIMCATAIAQQGPVGIVTMVTGDAKIFEPSAKAGRSVEMADVLLTGSRIVTGKSGTVSFVSCPHGSAGEAATDTEIVFSSEGFQVKRGSVLRQHKVPQCRVPVTNIGGRDSHIGGVNMRGETTMRLLSPVGTSVDPSQVTFRWQPVEGATSYRVTLRDANGSDLFESEAKAPNASLSYDGKKKLLPGESYRWRVTALQDGDTLSSASARLDVFSAEARARIAELHVQKGNENEKHLMLGMLYEELNAPDLALAEYEDTGTNKSEWIRARVRQLQEQLRK